MGEFDPSVCLRKITQLSRFINENGKKIRQRAFPNKKKYSGKSFYRPQKQTGILFAARGPTSETIRRNCESIFKRKTAQNTKNQLIRIVFQNKSTIKLVII